VSKTLKSFILTALLFVLSFFISQEVQATACAAVPLQGDYTVTTTCAFAGLVNGVEEGNLIINNGQTLTINNGYTVIWNPGYSVIIKGSVAINEGSPGGQLRKTYLWLIDADNDDYPSTTTQIAQSSHPTNGKRRKDFTNFTYVTDLTLDTNETNDCIDTVTHSCCDDTNPTDGLRPAKAAGEQGLPVCQRCDGVSVDAVNVDAADPGNIQDSEGDNKCDNTSGTCYRCLNGSCTYQTDSQDLGNQCAQGTTTDDGCRSDYCSGSSTACGIQASGDGGCPACMNCQDSDIACEYYAVGTTDSTEPGTCTATHYRCNGAGACTAPCSGTICVGWSTVSCNDRCASMGYCGCYGAWQNSGCYPLGPYSCVSYIPNWCECYRWMY
jgi:hypothetical protein